MGSHGAVPLPDSGKGHVLAGFNTAPCPCLHVCRHEGGGHTSPVVPDQVPMRRGDRCSQHRPSSSSAPPEPQALTAGTAPPGDLVPALIPGESGKQPPRAWHSVQEKQPPPHGPSPYDVGSCFPLLGQELGIVNNLLQKADHSELQLLVGFKVLPKPAQSQC